MAVLYLAYTEKGKTRIEWKQVWDREKFIAAQQNDKDNIKNGIVIGEATEQEYRDATWPKVQRK